MKRATKRSKRSKSRSKRLRRKTRKAQRGGDPDGFQSDLNTLVVKADSNGVPVLGRADDMKDSMDKPAPDQPEF